MSWILAVLGFMSEFWKLSKLTPKMLFREIMVSVAPRLRYRTTHRRQNGTNLALALFSTVLLSHLCKMRCVSPARMIIGRESIWNRLKSSISCVVPNYLIFDTSTILSHTYLMAEWQIGVLRAGLRNEFLICNHSLSNGLPYGLSFLNRIYSLGST